MVAMSSKWIEGISVLTDLTQRGELKWQIESQATGLGALSNVGLLASAMSKRSSYKARYQDKWFCLTKESDQFAAVGALSVGDSPFSLAIVDDAGDVQFRVPETKGLQDLFQAIQRQLVGVDSILESLLSERYKVRLR